MDADRVAVAPGWPSRSSTKDGFTVSQPGARDFDAAVRECRPRIFRFFLSSLRDPDTAAELTQDCFLRAHRNWSRFRGDSSIATWLTRIAINIQNDYWRNRRLQFWRSLHSNSSELDEVCEWVPSGERSAEQQMLAREQVGWVWKAVAALRERQRTIFLLRFVEELSLAEIATATGLHEGTVKAHLFRALRAVREKLAKVR